MVDGPSTRYDARRGRRAVYQRESAARCFRYIRPQSIDAVETWGDPRPKSGALGGQILKFLKRVPRHSFEDILPISLKVSKAAAIRGALK